MISLKTTLTINAASSGMTGIGLVVFANPIAELFGIVQTVPFVVIGIFLVLFSVFVFSVAFKKSIDTKAVRLIVTADTLWVIASLLLVVFGSGSITLIGIIVVLVVALWVAAMAYLQNKGLRSTATIVLAICLWVGLQDQTAVGQAASVYSSTRVVSHNNTISEAEALSVVTAFLDAVKEMSHRKTATLLDSLVEWHQPGNNRFSGVKKNANEVFAMFRGFIDMSAGTLRLADVKVMAVNGCQVACHVHWTAAQPPGKVLDIDNIDVYTVENGKITKAVVYSADTSVEDDFWMATLLVAFVGVVRQEAGKVTNRSMRL